jgi:OPA family glycerol-3-phosphate transporter-like MFS transporter/OPA family sugar phosphate sensor protein UhpC-like MFS transporter
MLNAAEVRVSDQQYELELRALDDQQPAAPRPGLVARTLNKFKPPAAGVTIESPQEVSSLYRHWRARVLATTIVGYAVYYFLRKNLSVAIPAIEADLGISKSELGLFLTLHGVLYGVSKFFNGFLGDRAHAAYFMAFGLICSAFMNLFFGLSSAVLTLGLFWLLNGYFQGMGFPPCARLITHWFSPKERATMFSVWNTSHSLGAAGVLVLTSYLVQFDWRLCFLVPALIGFGGALLVLTGLRDTPASLGLPEVETYTGDRAAGAASSKDRNSEAFSLFLRRHVFNNPLIWTLSLANFFVYVVRYAILDWGPSYIKEARGVELGHAGLMVACFEVGGVIGTLAGGVITDRVFKSHAGRACVVYMVACTALVYTFWSFAGDSTWMNCALLAGVGFFIYGPQCLVGVIAANLATKRAAATAIGLTGLFGYASTVLSGWGLGTIVQHFGWQTGFRIVVGCAVTASILFLTVWKVNAETELNARAPDQADSE